ncbi:hypothetical protein PR048_026603 [Dryococelus australis]|uniref:Uncharacterized protein n=1 Tax=Dryococelus australis TaxID=614101 RepID=A0ABQ9GLS6_9NEOP|nr:hypothetical protein PR048_026603 [Dryococelus australis]
MRGVEARESVVWWGGCGLPKKTHPGEEGLIPSGVARWFSQVGIVLDDAAGWRVFSGTFLRPCIPALLHTHVTSESSALKALHHKRRVEACTHPGGGGGGVVLSLDTLDGVRLRAGSELVDPLERLLRLSRTATRKTTLLLRLQPASSHTDDNVVVQAKTRTDLVECKYLSRKFQGFIDVTPEEVDGTVASVDYRAALVVVDSGSDVAITA